MENQPKIDIPPDIESPQERAKYFVQNSVRDIIEGISVVRKESMIIDFILSPWRYLDVMSGIYKENPELKKPLRLRK